jgi:arylsulfatase
MESYRTLGVSWANASNTPYRKYKWWNHEGGVSTPLIAYWPRVIKNGGNITHQVGHIMDIMATCLDIAGAQYPSNYNGQMVQPLEGKSLMPIFQGTKRQGHEVLYWQFGSSYAVRKGKWKLVHAHPNPRAGIDYFNEGDESKQKDNNQRQWELYDMESDRTELNDLAEKYPEIVKQMAQAWDEWNKRLEIN